MRTCLVTGAAGFIGSALVDYLLAVDPAVEVLALDALTYAGRLDNLAAASASPRFRFVHGDIRDAELLERTFDRYGPDVVMNVAAETHVDRSIDDPSLFASTNVEGTATLLEAARRAWEKRRGGFDGCRFLQVSTDEVYGSLGDEGVFSEQSPLRPRSPYAASKAGADLLALSYATTYGFPVVVTRSSNTYGPRQYPEKLVPLMIDRALRHMFLPVYGDGRQVRDWLHVDDHVRAIAAAAFNGRVGQVYNVGARCEKENLEIVDTIVGHLRDYADPSIDASLIRHVGDRPGHDRRYGTDPAKIESELGWRARVPFDEGMAATVRWYADRPEWLQEGGEAARADAGARYADSEGGVS